MSGHETLMSPDAMHKLDGSKEVWLDTTSQTLKIVKIWCADERMLLPVTRVNKLLRGWPKTIGHLWHAKSYFCLSETSFLG